MATMLELVNELHDKRNALIERQRAVHLEIEADVKGERHHELKTSADQLDTEIQSYQERISNMLATMEAEKVASEQRERFSALITPAAETGQPGDERTFADKMRTWLRAALPDAEVWAPRAITVHMGTVGMPGEETHDLTKGTATDGAELVPVGFVRTLFQHLIEFASVRQTNAQLFRTTSGENMLVPKTAGYGSAALVAEGGPIPEDDPQFGQVTVGAYKYGQLIQISRELIEDSAVDILGFLGRAAGIAIGVANGAHLVTGTGSAQPQGIANAPTAGVTGAAGTATSITATHLVQLYHSLISGYRRNGFWIMNDATAAAVRLLRDDSGGAGTGQFLWQPGLQAGDPDRLLGRPVLTDPNMAVMAANAYSVAFGDFSLYFAIRDVDGVRFERSDDYAFANDLVTFRALFRTDSRQLVNGASGAVKFYRNGAT